MHENAQNTRKVFDLINHYQKRIKNSSKIKKNFLEKKKCPIVCQLSGVNLDGLDGKFKSILS